MISARAHPNVALIKYWGKADDALRIPATPSLSIPLRALSTSTSIAEARRRDEVIVSGARDTSGRVHAWLRHLRTSLALEIPPLRIDSNSNFPTSAGLASSASGFAALAFAISKLLELDLDTPALSRLARLGSASAARSVRTAYMALDGESSTHDAWCAREVLDWDAWPLGVSVAICAHGAKSISSADGMRRSRDTSPRYDDWLVANRHLFEQALKAVAERDFDALAAAARKSFFGMLTVMQSSTPPLNYLNSASHGLIRAIGELQDRGIAVFCTSDAGPQVKCVYLPEYAQDVQACIEKVPGVLKVLQACP